MKNHIRWMIRRDMAEVLTIDNGRWGEEEFKRCLRQRNCIGMVVERGETIVGFMVYELHKNRLHILNLAVHPTYRLMGVGRDMVGKLIEKLSVHRRKAITWDVPGEALDVQMFLKAEGFTAIAVNTDDSYRFVFNQLPVLTEEV